MHIASISPPLPSSNCANFRLKPFMAEHGESIGEDSNFASLIRSCYLKDREIFSIIKFNHETALSVIVGRREGGEWSVAKHYLFFAILSRHIHVYIDIVVHMLMRATRGSDQHILSDFNSRHICQEEFQVRVE